MFCIITASKQTQTVPLTSLNFSTALLLRRFLYTFYSIQKMRQELSTILKYNLYRPDNAKLSLEVFFNSYSPYQYLLLQRLELPIFFDSALKNNDVTLKDYSKKITKFLDIAEKISKNR